MSESINDASFGGVVGRHFHFHPIPDCKPNETLAHLSGNVRENLMIVRQRDAKHGSGEHRHNGTLQFNGFFRIHSVAAGVSPASNVGPEKFSEPTFKLIYRRLPANERFPPPP
jgi:hypothetical protein